MAAKPKFRNDLTAIEQTDDRNDPVIVLKDTVSDRYFRLSAYEYEFLKCFDGTRTIDEATEDFKVSGRYCSPEDAKLILGKAAQLGLILGTRFGTAQFQKHIQDAAGRAGRFQKLSSLYFLYIPLVNPDRFLERTVGWFNLLTNKYLASVTALLVPGALYIVLSGLSRFDREYLYFFNLENLLYLWITIAVTKLVHELAHAYTAKSLGLRVPRMGVAFLIFFPCLYCDTTDAWQLADRRQRIAISAAGIIAEGILAVVSAYIWYFTKPSMLNSLAFYTMAVSFVSTVAFNGNPLMKFDGYFILVDYLGIPNLQLKSLGYLKYLFLNRVLGISLLPNTASDRREALLFGVYGVCAFLYRVVLYSSLIVGVYYRFDKLAGILLALLALALFVIRPLSRGAGVIYRQRAEVHLRTQAALVFSLVMIVMIVPLFIPYSSKSVYPCFVDSAQVRKLTVPLRTSISQVFVKPWDLVEIGTVLLELDASELQLALLKKRAEREILQQELEMIRLDPKEMGKAQSKLRELYHAEDELGKINEDLKIASGGITAPFSGVITGLDPRMGPGFRPGAGAVIGELRLLETCMVHALVPEHDRDKVPVGQEAEVWLPMGRGRTFTNTVESIRPYNERDLKDLPFSSRLGGELATEVKGERMMDAPLTAQYKCSVRLPNEDREVPFGMVGLFTVASPPRSIVARVLSGLLRTFRTELFL